MVNVIHIWASGPHKSILVQVQSDRRLKRMLYIFFVSHVALRTESADQITISRSFIYETKKER